MLIDFGNLAPREFLAQYFQRRLRAANKAAKCLLQGNDRMDALADAHAIKVQTVNEALRLGVAAVAIDHSCDLNSLSIRIGGTGIAHLPANLIADDVQEKIVVEAMSRTGD